MFATRNHWPFLDNEITSGCPKTQCHNNKMYKMEMLEIVNLFTLVFFFYQGYESNCFDFRLS